MNGKQPAQNISLADELHMIAQTHVQQNESIIDIPQQLIESILTETTTNISKSKCHDNDNDITIDRIQQNSTQSES